MPNIGFGELALLLLVLLLVFGPKRLPEMGRGLGRGLREFKDSVSGISVDRDGESETAEPAPLPEAVPPSALAEPTQSEPESLRGSSNRPG